MKSLRYSSCQLPSEPEQDKPGIIPQFRGFFAVNDC
nr:MAG TPA: hypothetical protein [Caudoviricetes sp.]